MKLIDEEGGEAQQVSPSSFLTRIIEKLSLFASTISAFLVVATLAITGFSVLRRYILGQPVTWTDELSGFLVVAIVMLGVAEVFRKNEHINVDILTSRLEGRARWVVDLWSNIAVIIVAGVLVYSSLKAVQFSRSFEIYSDGYLEAPLWIPQLFLVIGSGLLLCLAFFRFVDLLLYGRKF